MARKSAVIALLLTVAAYLVLFYTVPRIPVVNASSMAMVVALILTTAVFMGIQISLVRRLAEVKLSIHAALMLLVGSTLLFAIGFVAIATTQHEKLLHLAKDPNLLAELRALKPGISSYSLLYTSYKGYLVPVMNMLVIAAASLLGYVVSFLLRERNLILPVALFAGFIDFWTVSVGPTSKIVSNAPQIVHAVSAQIPTPGAGSMTPISFIGPGDFVFLAILFGAICRHGLNARRTFWFVYPLLTLGMLAVLLGGDLLGLESGLPALVLVALGVVLANLGQFRLSKNEIKAVAIVSVVLVSIVSLATVLLTGRH